MLVTPPAQQQYHDPYAIFSVAHSLCFFFTASYTTRIHHDSRTLCWSSSTSAWYFGRLNTYHPQGSPYHRILPDANAWLHAECVQLDHTRSQNASRHPFLCSCLNNFESFRLPWCALNIYSLPLSTDRNVASILKPQTCLRITCELHESWSRPTQKLAALHHSLSTKQ
jgi:hypothetical protein